MMEPNSPSEINVVVIGNYLPDQQRSMQRFTGLLLTGLRAMSLQATELRPPVCFGKLGAKPNGIGKWLGYLDKYLVAPFYLRHHIRRISNPRLIHIVDHSNAFYTGILKNEHHLVTCHDMLAIRSARGEFGQNQVSWTGRIQQWHILRGLKRSWHIACVSRATAADTARLTGHPADRITTVPNALSPEFLQSKKSDPVGQENTCFCQGRPYLLHVGSDAWYKNRAAVLVVFRLLADRYPDLQLGLVGPVFSEARLEAYGAAQLKDRIHYLEAPTDRDLLRIYTGAELFLFPSLIEGFGWPILEAQACGTEVVTSRTPPMSELNAIPELRIAGKPDTEEWQVRAAEVCSARMESMQRKTKDEAEERLSGFCNQFSLNTMAEHYANIYRVLINPEE